MKALGVLLFAACGAGLLLCGCGSSVSSGGSATSRLAGNWLIVGPMPVNGVHPSSGFRLAMTFDVTGNNVVAVGPGDNACNGSLGYTDEFAAGVTGRSPQMAVSSCNRLRALLVQHPSLQ